ncbi:hypothetical protein MHM84_12005 [Halomonas sp. McH1-25]|uniref:DUF4870 family protein n=1 Tax=unclassified Halomonas TaxID=2609666 RepID=UPI001EF53852|nr:MULTISPECIES: hypothetical protein [unclassified Halomonas]MCG7600515.1 hypothetical protein [Halomonas sp. McH1-25]MCP1343575.1 hypothetical protein [Halomonas sp. FL8]MCP1360022.1 hypothetical protein [Halomonas sp. BBD45]MCP1365738.1 hypothetical protein [Halomonas sp. BBD48]
MTQTSPNAQETPQEEPQEQQHARQQDITIPQVIYVLYLAGLITVNATLLVGVVMAYVYRGDAPRWLRAHYRYQIRTFWIGLVYSIAAFFLSLVAVGALAWPLLAVWLVVRCVIGLRDVRRRRSPANPYSWLW